MGNEGARQTDWKIVAAALFGGIVAALNVGKVPAALPGIRADLGLGMVSAGFVISIFNLLGMGLGALIGTYSETLGRRRMVGWGFLCLIAGGVSGAFSGGLGLLLFSRIFEGVGFIAIAVAMPSLIASAASARDRSLALSIWSVFTPAGFAIALLTTPLALGLVDWRGLWVSISVLTVIAGLIVTRNLATVEPPAKYAVTPMRRLRQVITRPRILLLALAFGTYALQWVTLMAWLPTFLVGELGFGLTPAAAATAAIVAVNVPGNILGGAMLRRRALPGSPILLGSAAMAISVLGIFHPGSSDGTRLLFCLVFSFLGGLIPSSLFAQVPWASPSADHLGPANGVLMQGSAIGQFAGPPIVAASIAAAGGGWNGAIFPMMAAAAVTACAGYFAARPPTM